MADYSPIPSPDPLSRIETALQQQLGATVNNDRAHATEDDQSAPRSLHSHPEIDSSATEPGRTEQDQSQKLPSLIVDGIGPNDPRWWGDSSILDSNPYNIPHIWHSLSMTERERYGFSPYNPPDESLPNQAIPRGTTQAAPEQIRTDNETRAYAPAGDHQPAASSQTDSRGVGEPAATSQLRIEPDQDSEHIDERSVQYDGGDDSVPSVSGGATQPTKRTKTMLHKEVMEMEFPDRSGVEMKFQTVAAARTALKARIAQHETFWLPPQQDDTIPQNDSERLEVAKKIFGALKDTSFAKDRDYKAFKARWLSPEYDDEILEVTAWEILDLAERLHREGPSVLPMRDFKFRENIKPSSKLSFHERIQYICTIAMEYKARCDGLIKGSSLESTVAAPINALTSARSNSKNNKERQQVLEWATEQEGVPVKKRGSKKAAAAVNVGEDSDEGAREAEDGDEEV